MPANPQVVKELTAEIIQVRQLWDTIWSLKKTRSTLAALGVQAMTPEQLAESCTGDLSHLDAGKITRLLAAMDALDATLVTAVELSPGVTAPPAKAIVDVIR